MEKEESRRDWEHCSYCAAWVRIDESVLRCSKCSAILCGICAERAILDEQRTCPKCGGHVYQRDGTITTMVAGSNAEDVAKVVREAHGGRQTAPPESDAKGNKLKEIFVAEGLKTIFVILAALIVAALLLWLGLK